MPVSDAEAADDAVSSINSPSSAQLEAQAKIIDILKAGDDNSFVDIHQLFSLYNTLYFRGVLLPRVELFWSPRLTLCAGLCEIIKDPITKKFSRILVKLSEPLLKFRPRSDLLNTLLHEAIHAYFFVTSQFAHIRDPNEGHGIAFHVLADAINDHGGYAITQFHEFHDEVDSYRRHVWQCNGPCRQQPPLFGLVKRVMNRPPGKHDTWWEQHQRDCGGEYTKIGEPEMSKAQLENLSALARAGRQKNKIDTWLQKSPKKVVDKAPKMPDTPSSKSADTQSSKSTITQSSKSTIAQSSKSADTQNLKSTTAQSSKSTDTLTSKSTAAQSSMSIYIQSTKSTDIQSNGTAKQTAGNKRPRSPATENSEPSNMGKVMLVACPICDKSIKDIYINEHLDAEHPS